MQKLNSILNRVPLLAWCVLIFIVALGARIYWFEEKRGFHCDESMSVTLSSMNSHEIDEKLKSHETISAKDLKEIYYGNEQTIKEIAKDIFHLRENNYDWCHTNIYYSLFRITLWNSDTTNYENVLFRGFILNLIIFTGTFIFLILLAREFFKNKKLPIILALVAGTLNMGMISMSVFLRPYELQAFTLVFFAYVFVVLAKKYWNEEKVSSWQNLILISWAIAVALLGTYFSIVEVVLLGLGLSIIAWAKTGFKEVCFLMGTFFFGIIVASAIYPNYILGFLVGRGTEAASKFSLTQILSNIEFSLLGEIYILLGYFLYLPVLILLMLVVISLIIFAKKEQKSIKKFFTNNPIEIVLFVATFLAMCAILYLAPYKIVRYVATLFPILALAIPWIIQKIHSQNIRFLTSIFIIFVFAGTTFLVDGSKTPSNFNKEEIKTDLTFLPKIYFLGAWENPSESYFDSKLPVVVLNGNSWHIHYFDLMKLDDSLVFKFGECTDKEKEPKKNFVNDFDFPNTKIVVTYVTSLIENAPETIILPKGKISNFVRENNVLIWDFESAKNGGKLMLKKKIESGLLSYDIIEIVE